jgi:hypothetical protein
MSKSAVDHRLFVDREPNVVEMVQRLTVFQPFLGPPVDPVRSCEHVLGRWRAFLNRCFALRAPDAVIDRWWSYYNCRPCGVGVGRDSLPCGSRHFCPFCYGREAGTVFARLMACLRGLDPRFRSEYTLAGLRWSQQVTATTRSDLKEEVDRAIDGRRSLIHKLDVHDGYASFTLSPRRGQDRWSACHRALLVAPGTLEPTEEQARDGLRVRTLKLFRTGVHPLKVARLVAWALAYPKGLILGDPARVDLWLQARKGHRLSAMFGFLRQSHVEAVSGEEGD